MQNSPTRSGIDVGAVLDETYTIEALIGRGGMGAVFLASHRRLAGKKVAIKMLLADLGGDEILARFKREADIASTLDHPNIVKVENYNVLPDGTPYIAYEFLQGESLAQRLLAGPLPLDQAFAIIRGVGSGLGAAHRAGIVHRDLKPQNIFLVQSEVAGHAIELAKVLDFGISKLRGSQTVKTQDSTLLGTPQYMAPEQATGQHALVDERSDLFALGAIVYEMLTGKPAFSGASIPEVVFKVVYEEPAPLPDSVPASVAAAIAKAMAKAPDERFPTVAAFVEALTGMPIALLPRPTLPPPIGSDERRKITANEAFAKTMGSGDHGEAPPVAPHAGTLPASVPPPPQAPPIVPVGVITNASTITNRKRQPWLIIGVLAVVVAIAATVALVVHGSHREAKQIARVEHRPPPPTPTPTPTPAPTTPPPPPPVIAPERVPVTTPDAAVAPTPPPVTQHAHTTTKPAADEPSDPDSEAKLAEAEASILQKNLGRAEQLANIVINSEAANKLERAHAHVLHGIVECVVRHSEENAQIDLRQVAVPAMRKRLIAACQAEGYLTGDGLH